MFDLSDHQLATLSAWAEIAILVWMVGEKFWPFGKKGHMNPAVPAPNTRKLWPFVWQNRTIVVAILGLGIVAWLHFRTGPAELSQRSIPVPISADNASLDFWSWEKSYSKESGEAFANGHLVNLGKATATNVRRAGILFMRNVPALPPDQVLAAFQRLRLQITDPDVGETEINPGQAGVWFTVYGPQVSGVELKKMDEGTFYPVVVNLLRYRDQSVPAGKYIYTQTCAVLLKDNVVGFCDGNYNKTFIAN